MDELTVPLVERDVGLGTAYERLAVYRLLLRWVRGRGVRRALEGPVDGMAGMAGLHLLPLARAGCRVTLQHPDAAVLRRAERVYQRCGLRQQLTLEQRDWPAAAQRFDLVLSFNALPLVADWRAYLQALADCSRAWLLLVVTNPWSYGARIAALQRRLARGAAGLFDHPATRMATLRPELAPLGRVVSRRGLDCPWWPDLFVPVGATLAQGLRGWWPPGRRAGTSPSAGPGQGGRFVFDAETFPCELALAQPGDASACPAAATLRRTLRRHPAFERAPRPLVWLFAHHQAYLVRLAPG